jgi:hypothetical protein
MKGLGIASRDTGQSRVPEPPDNMTASMKFFPLRAEPRARRQ